MHVLIDLYLLIMKVRKTQEGEVELC